MKRIPLKEQIENYEKRPKIEEKWPLEYEVFGPPPFRYSLDAELSDEKSPLFNAKTPGAK